MLSVQDIQLVSATHDFKFEAPDGKKRVADVFDDDGVTLFAVYCPKKVDSKIKGNDIKVNKTVTYR